MTRDEARPDGSTRREYLQVAGTVVAGGALAGCTGSDGASDTETTAATSEQPTEPTSEEATAASRTTAEESYEVCMAPNGCHTLDAPPERYLVYHQGPVDMMIALGQADGMVASAFPSTFPTEYLDQLPGVSFDASELTPLSEGGTPDKELFYELDVDLHLVGHHPAMEYFELDEEDLAELESNVAPFHGSWMRRPDYTDGHPYYTLYEGLDRYADVFRTEARGDAYREIHEDLVARLTAEFPPVEDRPSVAYLNTNYWDDGQTVYVRDPSVPGYQTKALRDLEVPAHDAFAGQYPSDGDLITGDFELLLEADPEVVVYHAGLNVVRDDEVSFEEDILRPLREDPVAGEVTAIAEGRVYPWHEFEQGPIINQFQTEVLAKSLYPETFGEPTGMAAPPAEERLFDRRRVADVVNGDL
jgi:iron complex transport system substrate-binding protein